MSTRAFVGRRYWTGAIVVTMALVAVLVLAVQEASIWSANGSKIAPAVVPAWRGASGFLSTASDPGGNVRSHGSLLPNPRPTPRVHPRPKWSS